MDTAYIPNYTHEAKSITSSQLCDLIYPHRLHSHCRCPLWFFLIFFSIQIRAWFMRWTAWVLGLRIMPCLAHVANTGHWFRKSIGDLHAHLRWLLFFFSSHKKRHSPHSCQGRDAPKQSCTEQTHSVSGWVSWAFAGGRVLGRTAKSMLPLSAER